MSESSVPAQDIIKMCNEQGFLAKQLYVVWTTATNGIGPVLENIKDHLEFQVSLEKRGIMFAAGPQWTDDEKSWEGDGMVVIRAASLAEAREIAASDPMHKSGARKFTVRPWFVNEGTMTLKLDFSKKRFELT